jgi:hypothetical protein
VLASRSLVGFPAGFHQIDVGARQPVLVADAEGRGSLGDLHARVGLTLVGDDRLQFQEGTEALDVVQMDARVAPEVERAALGDDGADADGARERLPQRVRVGDGNEDVVGRARVGLIGAGILDELGRGAFDLAQLQAAVRDREIGVALDQQPCRTGAQRREASPRRLRVRAARFDLDVGRRDAPCGYCRTPSACLPASRSPRAGVDGPSRTVKSDRTKPAVRKLALAITGASTLNA